MSIAHDLNDTERRILAVAEEAGEENVCALVNTVIRRVGNVDEISLLVDSLLSLKRRELVELADSRDEELSQWIPLHSAEATQRLHTLLESLIWSQDQALWLWTSPANRLTVLLTERGRSVAAELLRTFGWNLAEPV
ncbi:MAG: hypothetical protein ACYC6Y_28655 [Thermoguttaceae bacterium]